MSFEVLIRVVFNFLRTGFKRLKDRAAESFAGTLILAVLAGGFWLFGTVPDAVYDGNGNLSFQAVGTWIWTIVSSTFSQWFESVLEYLRRHPIRSAVRVAAVSALCLVGYFLFRYGRVVGEILRELVQTHDLAQRTGLFGFSPTARPDQEIGDWNRLSENINSPENRIVYILGATGWDTFGHRNAPLYEPLSQFNGNVRIILMDETSKHLSARARSVGMTEAGYRRQIRKTIARLKELRGKGRFIELALYDSPPNWKMIITAQYSWIQHYWRDSHVADTPVYLFYATDDQKGLYHAFFDDFDRIWNLAKKAQL